MLSIHLYSLGYKAQVQISTRRAKELRGARTQPLWLLMSPGHFSALLPA